MKPLGDAPPERAPSACLRTGLFDEQQQAMTTIANLLARKQQLLDRLQENPEPSEREEYERVLAKIEIALNLLDKTGPADHDV